MIEFNIILFIIVIHFLADFVLQTDDQAKNKSTSIKWLVFHTGMYSLIWLLIMPILLEPIKCLQFATITFCAHTLTDYITSRVGKPFWSKGDTHFGFVTVGFDQVLHYLQLFLTYLLLK